MPNVTFSICIDENLKKEFFETAQSLGFTPTTAINVFARQFVARRGFPFAVKIPETCDDKIDVADVGKTDYEAFFNKEE